MFSKPHRRYRLAAGLAIVTLCLVAAGQQQRLFALAAFKLRASLFGPHEASMGLADYRATRQAQAIEGLANVSALTYNPERNTLFTVTNKDSELVELSLQGEVVRRIRLVGFGDPEGVEYIRPGLFVVSDEHQQRLLAVQVDDATTVLDAAHAQQLVLNLGGRRNRGFEGLAFDRKQGRLFVANEQSPMTIYEIRGFPAASDANHEMQILQNAQRDADLFMTDLSSLDYDQRHDHLLALSDQSHLLVELGDDHKPIGTLLLRGGFHGLRQTVPQAEGVAMDDAGVLYLVSEPNLFYVFEKAP